MTTADAETVRGLIRGAYDMHVHSAPDVLPRKFDDTVMAQHALDVLYRNRHRPRTGADEARDASSVLHDVPELVVQLHAHEHVAGEELALARAPLPLDHLDDVLFRNEDLLDRVLAAVRLDPFQQALLGARFLPRVRVDDVPISPGLRLFRHFARRPH